MANSLQPPPLLRISNDRPNLSKIYDEHSAVMLGFLQKLANDKEKAEELLQAVFVALPSRIREFDPHKGRFVTWLLSLARGIAHQRERDIDIQTNGRNVPTKQPIQAHSENVTFTRTGTVPGNDLSAVELIYVKGYTFVQAAAELGTDVRTVQLMVRTELKKYRS